MGAIISCCCYCCDRESNKYHENYQPTNVSDATSKTYDNKVHVSEIYGINTDVELAPSDNPKTSTYFQSIIHPPKELAQQSNSASAQSKTNEVLPESSNSHDNATNLSMNLKLHRTTLDSSSSLSPAPPRYQTDTNRPTATHKSLKHSNSCSTIYVDDSTVSQPNWKAMIKCVSIAIHSHILHRKSNKTMEIFDEKLHPLSKEFLPDDYDIRIPEQKVIYRFMRVLFTAAQLTAECAIVTLVYLERVLSYGELDLCPSNWKRLVLGAVMLASKVWDDQAVWNVDFCQILKDITVHEMNELEREYVQLLQFNVNVASSIYAKYYFDLRQIAKENQISFPDELLTKEKAIKLEALSMINNRLQQPSSSSTLTSNQPNTSQNHTNSNQVSSQQQSSAFSYLTLRRSASVEFTQSQRKSLLIIS
ncbi:unnamed protein product [Rotaria magnacalcarata]|uniref:Cyclin-like domain-containing protein n=1 Tax=Rotaria magnacalcarata TaxID=392030 RepID=A0A814DH07_9BILA|nr:unnamed protein product [Rotaria magnacalcarata]CAF1659638.1 unnamed protein product [Rotaria magnacalcarata]CAF2102169.1 unnamed protein product [Rotaria magnacalcarata]CAF3921662.1 unnamed protein product [Rotaria magnacalcarata]CAF4000628.1 unnamed protein product [Rotaria magnacalcarata]